MLVLDAGAQGSPCPCPRPGIEPWRSPVTLAASFASSTGISLRYCVEKCTPHTAHCTLHGHCDCYLPELILQRSPFSVYLPSSSHCGPNSFQMHCLRANATQHNTTNMAITHWLHQNNYCSGLITKPMCILYSFQIKRLAFSSSLFTNQMRIL